MVVVIPWAVVAIAKWVAIAGAAGGGAAVGVKLANRKPKKGAD